MADCHPLSGPGPKAVAGAYELCDAAGEIVYIGKATDVRKRMAEHASGNTTECIKQEAKGYRYFIGDPDRLEIERLRAYKAAHAGRIPPCNDQDPSA